VSIEVLEASAVARMLGCAVTTVEERARSGDLPGLKFGDGGWVFPAGALAKRLDELALEQAAARRRPVTKSAVLRALPKAEKSKRSPPTLPQV
jgi:hypothetical protein